MAFIKNYIRILDIFMTQSHRETFGKYLTPSYKLLSDNKNKGLRFAYTVPKHLCRQLRNSNGNAEFSTSGIMAVFDQLSTYGLMAEDKYRPRGGVSVLLSTEVLKPSFPNQELIVVSKSEKVGKSLGFSTMELQTTEGTVLARGKHIKYLPLGVVYDILSDPYVLPLVLFFHDTMQHTQLFQWLRTGFTNIPGEYQQSFPVIEGDDTVFDILGLKPSTFVDSNANSDTRTTDTRAYELAMLPHLNNNIGKMHGGAVAAVVEQACYLLRDCFDSAMHSQPAVCVDDKTVSNNKVIQSPYFIQAIEVRYQSAMEGDLVVVCSEDGSADKLSCGASSKTVGRIFNKVGGLICAEFVCTWAPT